MAIYHIGLEPCPSPLSTTSLHSPPKPDLPPLAHPNLPPSKFPPQLLKSKHPQLTPTVLFKLIQNPGPTQDQLAAFRTAAENMVGKVPGLQRIDIGPPHAISAMRAQGFDMGLVAVLDKAETIKVYAEHPEHLK